MPNPLLSVVLLAGFFFMVTGCGLFVMKWFRTVSFSPGERLFLGYGIGAGLIGYGVFALAALQLLYAVWLTTFLSLVSLVAIAGWRSSGIISAICAFRLPQSPAERVALTILCTLLGTLFFLTLTPETGKDALIYHLGVPNLYLKKHGFYFIEGNVFSNLPFHTEMLFLLGLFLHGDILAKGIAFLALPFIMLGMGVFVANRMAKNEYPFLCMLVFAMIPSVFVLAHTAYIDLYVAFYALSLIYAFTGWHERQERAWLVLCAFFAGLAISCKYSALFFPFPVILGILWRHRSEEEARRALRDIFTFLLVTVAVSSPFYLKNWAMTGNPLYPFMYQIFGGRGIDAEFARLFDILYKFMGMGRGWLDYMLLPWNLSFRAEMNSVRFDGVLGPIFLLVLPFLFGVRQRLEIPLKIMLTFSIAFFLFWASSSQDIRYLSPVLPLFALMTGSVLTYYRGRNRLVFLALFFAILFGLVWNARYIARDIKNIRPVGVVMGTESKEEFMNRSLSHYAMYDFMNAHLPADAKVYLIYMRNLIFLCERECYADSMYEQYTLQKILTASTSPADVYQSLKARGFTYLAFDRVYVTGSKSLLTSEQIALFKAFQGKYLTLLHTSWTNELYLLK